MHVQYIYQNDELEMWDMSPINPTLIFRISIIYFLMKVGGEEKVGLITWSDLTIEIWQVLAPKSLHFLVILFKVMFLITIQY